MLFLGKDEVTMQIEFALVKYARKKYQQNRFSVNYECCLSITSRRSSQLSCFRLIYCYGYVITEYIFMTCNQLPTGAKLKFPQSIEQTGFR